MTTKKNTAIESTKPGPFGLTRSTIKQMTVRTGVNTGRAPDKSNFECCKTVIVTVT